jgi:signal transduction histidine kinase
LTKKRFASLCPTADCQNTGLRFNQKGVTVRIRDEAEDGAGSGKFPGGLAMKHGTLAPQAITRASLELVLTRSVGSFGLLLYCLALPDVLIQIPIETVGWDLMFIAGIPAAILWSMLVPRPGTWLQVSTGTAAMLMICSFLLWHLGFIGTGTHADSRPWSYGISGLGIALSAIAFRASFAAVYAGLFCLLILLVPVTDAGNARSWYESGQDALLGVVLAVVIISPITALRRAATASDNAAQASIVEAAAAAQAEALSVERTRLDGLTHDTVMATLTVAAQASTGEVMEAAAQAARDSLCQLDGLHRPEVEGASISPDELVNRLRGATLAHETRIRCDTSRPVPRSIPLAASRALIQATAEAVRNSAIHASGTSEVSVQFSNDPFVQSVVIQISDNGPGFDLAAVAPQRLGIRVSIIKRMQDICGEAVIDSRLGAGTRVRLTWMEMQEYE